MSAQTVRVASPTPPGWRSAGGPVSFDAPLTSTPGPCMHYAEDRQRSAEVLRLALAHMGRQPASLNPCSYAIWYEHCAGLNPGLSKALESLLARGTPLSNQDVFALYTEHILARDVQLYEGMREQLYRLLNDTAANAASASAQASAYDQALLQHSAQLSEDAGAVGSLVEGLLSETAKMRAVTQELAAKLQASTEEVSQLTESLLRAKTEAVQDALTQLKNRRGFEEAVGHRVAEQGTLEGCAMLVVDVDHFKAVNDTHGHLLGDKVLRVIAQVMQGCIKGQDILARLGGEEFVVLLPKTNAFGAQALGEQIRQAVGRGRITALDGTTTLDQVTVSVGVTVARGSDSLETLLARADEALYSAKRAGRNRVITRL